MKLDETFKFINNIEIKYGPMNHKILGIRFWPYLRMNLFLNQSVNKISEASNIFRYLKYFLFCFVNFFKINIFLLINKKNYLESNLFISSKVFYIKLKGKSYDRIMDPLNDLFKSNNLKSINLLINTFSSKEEKFSKNKDFHNRIGLKI